MNESFKDKYSSYITEAVDDSDKAQLKKALVMRSMNIVANGGNIKDLEIALQDVIENFYPDKCWWEVTDCQIFNELLGGCNPRQICDMIVDQLKPEFCNDSSVEESVPTGSLSDNADAEAELEESGKSMSSEIIRGRRDRIIEALTECLRRMNEDTISPEDQADSDMIRGMIAKLQKRSNARFTPEEQGVMQKYGIERSNWDKQLTVGGRPLNPNYDGDQRKVWNSYNDWRGHYVHNGDPGKINYADRARKLPQRADNQIGGRWSPNGAVNAHTRRGFGTLQDLERNTRNAEMQEPVNTMKQHLNTRNYNQSRIDNAQSEYDKSMASAKAQYDRSMRWATDTYKRDTVNAAQSRDAAQNQIDRMLKRK